MKKTKSRIGLAGSLTILTIFLVLFFSGQSPSNIRPIVLISYPLQVAGAAMFSSAIFSLFNRLTNSSQPEEYRHHTYLLSAATAHIAIAFSFIVGSYTALEAAALAVVTTTGIMYGVSFVSGITSKSYLENSREENQ